MHPLFYLPVEIAKAFLFAASIGIATGVVAISFTHRLGDGLSFGFPGFLIAAATFGWLIWKSYRPRAGRRLPRTAPALPRQVA